MFFELAQSATLLLSLALIYGFIIGQWRKDELISKVISGCIFGFICIVGMNFSIILDAGVIFDARSVILTISSVFGGPIVGILSALIAGIYRAWIGGGGTIVGITVIIWAMLAGLGYRYLVDIGKIKMSGTSLLGLGFINHIVIVGLFSFLPSPVIDSVFESIALPFIFAFAPGTALLGLVFQAVQNEIQTKKDLENAIEARSKALEKIIHVLGAALEKRDPYTAGHQENVARIAGQIGRKLGLSSQKIEGLELAAAVHDVGKIQVPSEILAKPTKLSNYEFEIIKTHSREGSELLEGIDFDWPIATIIRQHHERLDGSGYPDGLKADNILQEAKIIAVADTLEAMASHRPYRAGLGIDAARAELIAGRGTKYDPAAVDACLMLISEEAIKI
ncbi:MAG: HD-GYP domain-containing protein [Magnetovibrionaceae bacterium]